MSLWAFNLHEYLSADNLLNIYMAHSTHDIWALYISSVIWWSALITVFRQSNKTQRILFAKILVHLGRTMGCCCYISLQNSIFCPAMSNVLTHSRLTCFPGPCLLFQCYYMCIWCWDFSTLLLTNSNLNPLLRPRLPFLESIKKQSLCCEAISAHALEMTGTSGTFSGIIWIQATRMVQHGDNYACSGFVHYQMSWHQFF